MRVYARVGACERVCLSFGVCVCVCVCACACVRACVRACVHTSTCVTVNVYIIYYTTRQHQTSTRNSIQSQLTWVVMSGVYEQVLPEHQATA